MKYVAATGAVDEGRDRHLVHIAHPVKPGELEVVADNGAGLFPHVNKISMGGAPREGLNTDGTGAGEEIQDVLWFDTE